MSKCYVKIKTLGTEFQEPIYLLQTQLEGNKKQQTFFSDLSLDVFKAEGRFIPEFLNEVKELKDKESNAVYNETEKGLFQDFSLFLLNENVDEIVVADKLSDMLFIEERMKANKFKTETYRFRNFKLSEEPTNSFFDCGRDENSKEEKDSLIQRMKNKLK